MLLPSCPARICECTEVYTVNIGPRGRLRELCVDWDNALGPASLSDTNGFIAVLHSVYA